MRTFKPQVSLAGRKTFSLGIADSIRASIVRGQLRPGELLPSTRELAAELRVHRHTVLAALEILVSEGRLEAHARRGFSVSQRAQFERSPPTRAAPSFAGFRIVRDGARVDAPPVSAIPYPLHSATPDPTLAPHAELKAAYAHVLRRPRRELFEIADERGHPPFIRVLGDHVRQNRGLVARELMVTHGSQEAIALVARALVAPGDVVAVEEPGYPPAWDAFRAAGARLAAVRVDAQGLDVEALTRLAKRRRVRLLYTTPAHHFPTSVTLSPERRGELLTITARHGIPILEDDYDHEYQYVGLPVAPLAADSSFGHVIYAGTLSKLIGSGVRLGFVVAAPELLQVLARLCRIGTRGHDPVAQAALAAWMGDGGLERHLRRARRAYVARREALLAAFAEAVSDGSLALQVPNGGLGLWARFRGCDSMKLALAAQQRGITVLPEQSLRLREATCDGARLSFSRCPPDELLAAGAELLQIARELRR
ncbi:MAG TPA: PLP-dependent aminotransferase family protein [Polyangiaceae bacterium]|nr:PLP-dependent aminotransferase family protein [Polyangiaceae bacterium]